MRSFAPSLKTSFYFCMIVFAFSLILWLLEDMFGDRALGIPINLPASSLMAFFPLITACIFAYGKDKGKGIRHLFDRLIDWRPVRRKIWYLPAVLLMPAVLLAVYLFMSLMQYPLPEPDLHLPMIPVFFCHLFHRRGGGRIGLDDLCHRSAAAAMERSDDWRRLRRGMGGMAYCSVDSGRTRRRLDPMALFGYRVFAYYHRLDL